MNPLKVTFSIAAVLSSSLLATQAYAKSSFLALQPIEYNNAIGCTSCHSSSAATSSNVTQPYGVLFNSKIGYNNATADGYRSLEPYDVDGDGFTNGQEIFGGSDINTALSKPTLGIGATTSGSVSVKALVNETVSNITQVLTTPASVQAMLTTGQKNIGGTIDLTLTNLTLGTASPSFMFSTGGVATGAQAYFINADGSATAIAGAVVNSNGSLTVKVTGEGPYDLYTQANYVAAAKARTPAFTPTNVFDVYAGISPDANISPSAIIDPYAVIDAYAIVDAYATVNASVAVYSYAYIAPNVVVSANVDPYVSVTADVTIPAVAPTFTGSIQTKVAVVTTSPVGTTTTIAGSSSDDGGLHCMTSGLSTYGFMLMGLLATAFLVRRKNN